MFAERSSSSSERSTAGRKVEVEVVAVGVVAGGLNEGLSTRVDSDEPWRAIRGTRGGKSDLGFEPDEFISSWFEYTTRLHKSPTRRRRGEGQDLCSRPTLDTRCLAWPAANSVGRSEALATMYYRLIIIIHK